MYIYICLGFFSEYELLTLFIMFMKMIFIEYNLIMIFRILLFQYFVTITKCSNPCAAKAVTFCPIANQI